MPSCRSIALLLALVVSAGMLAGCASAAAGGGAASGTAAGGGASSGVGRLQVVTTVAPITSIVAAVAGDLADVHGLIPEGADSHTFEPPPSAARILSHADLVFVNGLQLEDPTRDLARHNRKRGSAIVELGTQSLPPDQYIFDFSFPRSGGKPNPHLWTDPPFARRYAELAADTLANRDPAHASAYRANAQEFAAAADRLDAAMRIATATLPATRRTLLTYHDAYAYFARDYGWRVIGAMQVSSFEDPTPQEVARLIDQIRRQEVPAIFGSEVFPSPVLAQIGKETGVRYVDTLRDDDLPGKPGDPDHSWFGLMRADFVTMVTALGGDAAALRAAAPARGLVDRAGYPQ